MNLETSLNRRKFLKIGTMLGLALVGCGSQLQTTAQPTPLEFLHSEISANPGLPSLRVYPGLNQFAYSAYKLVTQSTGNVITAERLLENSNFGGIEVMPQFIDGVSWNTVASDSSISAETYGLETGLPLKIAYNLDADYFKLSELEKAKSAEVPNTVLEALVTVLFHEPIHAITTPKDIDLLVMQNGDKYQYAHQWAMAMYGKGAKGQKVAHFGLVDEVTVHWLQNLILTKHGFSPATAKIELDVMNTAITFIHKYSGSEISQLVKFRQDKGASGMISLIKDERGRGLDEAFQRYVIFNNIITAAIKGDAQARKDLELFVK